MKKILLLAAAFLGISAGGANAACTSPAVMHDFPGTSFNMSLASAPDGNCASNNAITTWGGVTLGAASNYGTSPGTVAVPGVNAFVTNTVAVSGTFWQATQPVSVASGAVASGAYASGSLAAGAGTDGWDSTQGAKADAACGSDNGTCSVAALLKRNNQNLTTLNGTAGNALAAGSNLIGKVGFDQTTPGTTNNVTLGDASSNALVLDPCQGAVTSTPINISSAATSVIVAGTASKKTYVCGMMLFSAGTTNVGIVQGSGTTCGTSTLGLIGGATAGTGPNLTAQAGFNASPSGYHIAATTVNANDVCLINGSAIQVSGYIVTAVR